MCCLQLIFLFQYIFLLVHSPVSIKTHKELICYKLSERHIRHSIRHFCPKPVAPTLDFQTTCLVWGQEYGLGRAFLDLQTVITQATTQCKCRINVIFLLSDHGSTYLSISSSLMQFLCSVTYILRLVDKHMNLITGKAGGEALQ